MNTRSIVGVVLALVVVGGALFYFSSQAGTGPAAQTSGEQNGTSGMRAEENAIVVGEQRPGKAVVVSSVHLASPGFVVIHDDVNGAPGAIIGASALLRAGESTNIRITLSRSIQDGEKLHAMLHADPNGDGTFNPASDVPVQSVLGGPLEGWFDVSSSASDETPVSI